MNDPVIDELVTTLSRTAANAEQRALTKKVVDRELAAGHPVQRRPRIVNPRLWVDK